MGLTFCAASLLASPQNDELRSASANRHSHRLCRQVSANPTKLLWQDDQRFGSFMPPVAMSTVMLPPILTSVLPILNEPSLPAGNASSGSGCGAGLAMRSRR